MKAPRPQPDKRRPRPFIGVHFKCCHVYTRIYLNRQRTAYSGFCPKCGGALVVKAVPGGSKARFWTAE